LKDFIDTAICRIEGRDNPSVVHVRTFTGHMEITVTFGLNNTRKEVHVLTRPIHTESALRKRLIIPIRAMICTGPFFANDRPVQLFKIIDTDVCHFKIGHRAHASRIL